MEKRTSGWTLKELADELGGVLDGPSDLRVVRPVATGSSDPQGLAFAENEEYLSQAEASEVGAILVPHHIRASTKPVIRCAHPKQTFGLFLAKCVRPLPVERGIHPLASVSPEATISPDAFIGPFAVIERGAAVRAGARVYSFAYVGEDCLIDEHAVIYPHAVLYQQVCIGKHAIIHAGAVLGADGFGFYWDGSRQVKIPQVGNVTIGDNVEIGACTTIDRAMFGTTSVGRGSKLDNLVQMAHNSTIGEHSVVAGLTGISGSTHIGDRCTVAGQTGFKDHVTVGDDIVLAGRAGVTKDILQPGVYFGFPARPRPEQQKIEAVQGKLPDIRDRLKALEKRIAELEDSK